jgi:nicotine blue oxidoreductase
VLHTVDTPDVGAGVVARVLARSADTGLARATYGGRPGHPVVIAAGFWQALLGTLSGDEGARPFLAHRDDVVLVECGDLASGLDVDERLREEQRPDERLREEQRPDERLREEQGPDEC